MTAQLIQVKLLRQRGYEIAQILRHGCIMHRAKDDASLLVERDGTAVLLDHAKEAIA